MKVGRHTLKGDHIKTAKKIQKHKDEVLGSFLAIDPASRSMGWAYFMNGSLIDSGTVEAKGDVHQRLAVMYHFVEEFDIDAMAIEFIGGARAHRYLSWACGAIAAAQPDVPLIEVKTNLWKKFVDKDYTKDDEEDAKCIGRCVVGIAND